MNARFEIGEVLLTARIVEILRQFVFGIMPWDIAAGDKFAECETAEPGEFTCFAKRENLLGVKRDRQF